MSTTMSTNSTGMAMLENFSIPFFTPPSTIPATRAMNTVCERMGCQVEEMKLPKKPETASGEADVKSKESDLKRYWTDQPPTTE